MQRRVTPAFAVAAPLRAATTAGAALSPRAPCGTPLRQTRPRAAVVRAPARMAGMITPEAARVAIAVYGVAIAGGGIGAFARSGSKPSLISGVVAGIVLALAYVKDSVPVALGTAIALTAVFAVRLVKTKKVVPAGVLCAVSLAAAVLFAVAVYA